MQIRIDQREGRRQLFARQVVIGDHHINAMLPRQRHAGDARHAVVHRDEHLRRAFQGHAHQFRRQAVAVLEPVGHQKVHVARAECLEQPDAQRRSGGAVGIEVADDQDALALLDGIGKPRRRRVDVRQFGGRVQIGEGQRHVRCGDDAPGGQCLAQKARQFGIERLGRDGAGLDLQRAGPRSWPRRARSICAWEGGNGFKPPASWRRGRPRGCASPRRSRRRGPRVRRPRLPPRIRPHRW